MLNKVSVGSRDLQKYRMILGSELIDEIEALAAELEGIRLCHVNSTAYGGGVAEMLSSYIPLMRSIGIAVDWQVIHGDPRFFTVTKALHNALQGGDGSLLRQEESRRLYQMQNQFNASELDRSYDVFIINDPQPAAIRHYSDDLRARWIWRCHIDTSQPDRGAWDFLRPFVEEHDAAVFTMRQFVPPDLNVPAIATIAPAIDALSPKNMALPRPLCREMTDNLGIARDRPLILQVSRFDPWKDPFGVMEIYRIAKQSLPGLQLALVGALASDDPEGYRMYAAVNAEADKDDDIHVFTNLTGVGSMQVNAFQTASDVAIQKSIREGFGLVVSEALWKSVPVVAGKAGGIPMQMTGDLSAYLIQTVEECAEKVVGLIRDRELALELGRQGKEHVKRSFLMPRLIRDELALVRQVLGAA